MNEIAAWVRAQAEADLAAAKIISPGGFEPQRWDTEPPGQVNPVRVPYRRELHALLVPDAEDRLLRPAGPGGWVQIVSYARETGEPPEEDWRDSDLPVMLVDDGRREAAHVIRHDPRTEAARAESVLAVVDLYERQAAKSGENAMEEDRAWTLEPVVRLLAWGYRCRAGWRPEWAP